MAGWEHLMIVVVTDPFTILRRAEVLGCRQSESVFQRLFAEATIINVRSTF
jgi:hypothetical protein